ncbi:MAG TPA: carboxyl transferase domain-containing protein [Solirubrobacteraceae bacterium]|jgi:acetyl-CoA carboxylase carboxyltransferase component
MSWEPELEELRRRQALAARLGGEERVARQHASGRLTVRERIDALLDPGSWRETGGLAGVGTYDADGEMVDFTPSTMIVGQGHLDGRGVIVQADDFTVRGGAGDDAVWRRMVWAERAAHDLRLPLVRLVDGTGGGGSVKTLEGLGYASFPTLAGGDLVVANLSRVPVAAAALGPCAGLGAARVVQSHFSVIVNGTAQLFVAGPPVVAWAMGEHPSKEDLGGARAQLRAGAVDNEASDEEDAFAQMKRFLSYLPPNVWEAPPIIGSTDPIDRAEQELLSIVPREERQIYRMRRVLELIFDRGSVFELGARFGRSTITVLARLGGRPVGVIASDPLHYGGGLTAAAAEKQTRFIDMCDQFRLPVVNLVDQPGFVVGTGAERAGTMRRGARLLAAVMQATTPWCSIIVRKCFGIAGAAHGDGSRLNLRYAWPSGSWGSLPIAGGLEAAYRRELEEAADPVAMRADIEQRLRAVVSAFRTAEHFSIEDIIDPRDTRRLLCLWAAQAHAIVGQDLRSEAPIRRRGLRP